MVHARTKPAGAARTYGVLVGTIKAGQMSVEGNSPHYEIWITAAGGNFRAAVNVQSVDGSDVLALFVPSFTNPTKLNLAALAAGVKGFTSLPTGPAPTGKGLDYLRDNLFDVNAMSPIPDEGSGVTLQNLLDAQIQRAKADPMAVAVVFGEFFQDPGADPNFGFSREEGIHDIHMMQGNSGTFSDDNQVNGDGALFVRFSGGETIALFVRFDTQSLQTDPTTGNPV